MNEKMLLPQQIIIHVATDILYLSNFSRDRSVPNVTKGKNTCNSLRESHDTTKAD